VPTPLDYLLDASAVRAVFRPIVERETKEVVAYDALPQGPVGSELEDASALFDAARAEGRLRELDWAFRRAALEDSLAAGVRPPLSLFLRVEADALHESVPEELAGPWERARRDLSIVLEFSERALLERPAELLRTATRVRELGWGVALGGVGASLRCLALMPLLRPDTVRLDLALVERRSASEFARISTAVSAYAEHTGAIILADGVETDDHLAEAAALGATLAGGPRLGASGPLPSPLPKPTLPVTQLAPPPRHGGSTPMEILVGGHAPRRASKDLLLAMTHHLEGQAAALGEGAIVLSTFEGPEHFGRRTSDRYEEMARHSALVAALGPRFGTQPAPGVRGAALETGDPIATQWTVIVVGQHFAAALASQAVDAGLGPQRTFEFVLTYDRKRVTEAAAAVMARLAPLSVRPVDAAAAA